MRLLRVPRLRISLPKMSPTTRANGSVIGILTLTFIVISWNSHAKPAGAYHGAVAPVIEEIVTQPTPVATSHSSNDPAATVPSGPQINGKLAARLKHGLMLDAKSRLQSIPDYIATFTRQERVNGHLLPRESTDLKVRHTPFSVYMKWNEGSDIGRELLFVKGQNGGRMLIKKGGKVGDLLPTFKLEPTSDMAMKESRHPVSDSGVLNLVEKILGYCERDLKRPDGVNCQFLPDQKIDNRMCYAIRTDYASADIDPDYRCSMIFVERETGIPLCVKNYGWPEQCGAPSAALDKLSDETLVEFYAFTGLRYQSRLNDLEFDQANAQYRFRRE